MWGAPFFPALPPSDRLRLLTEGLRHVGAAPWLTTALDYLADELEASEPRAEPTQGDETEVLP
jgi:hypothetical protein